MIEFHTMKDNFSAQSVDYSKFRPHYPPEMIDYIVSYVQNREAALDVGTGNGQVAAILSELFQTVDATDISARQLESAIQKPNIRYAIGSAEETGFDESQFDLITVAQAIHWFNFDVFYKEVYRVLRNDGIFAVLGYGLMTTNSEADKIIGEFYHEITGPYWDPERRYLDENYETIPFPFEELPSKPFSTSFIWTIEQLIGYLGTWSAVHHFIAAKNFDPLDLIREKLSQAWEKSNKEVTFNFLLRIGKKTII